MANKLYNTQVANSRVALKKGGFLKKVGKAAAGIGAAVLAAKGFRKKPAAKKKDAVDKYFAKKGMSLKTGDASAAESMAKADRDKKIFRRGLDKIAKRGTVDEKDYDMYGKRIKKKFGGSLKSVDKNTNPGLAKLPTKVRNKMGFMKDGGKVNSDKLFSGPRQVKKPETRLSPELSKKFKKALKQKTLSRKR